jgi:hypothetical protein
MPRGPCSFKQSAVTRAVRGAKAAGLVVHSVQIDHAGTIVLNTRRSDDTTVRNTDEPNPWDQVLIDAQDEKRSS